MSVYILILSTGYHTAHHMRPEVHWSRLPEIHRREILPHQHANLRYDNIGTYLYHAFVFPGKLEMYDGRPIETPFASDAPDIDWIEQEAAVVRRNIAKHKETVIPEPVVTGLATPYTSEASPSPTLSLSSRVTQRKKSDKTALLQHRINSGVLGHKTFLSHVKEALSFSATAASLVLCKLMSPSWSPFEEHDNM